MSAFRTFSSNLREADIYAVSYPSFSVLLLSFLPVRKRLQNILYIGAQPAGILDPDDCVEHLRCRDFRKKDVVLGQPLIWIIFFLRAVEILEAIAGIQLLVNKAQHFLHSVLLQGRFCALFL